MNTNKLPLVSIIIPVYNCANFVAEAIESALRQTHDNIEIIVVDDGSADDTAGIVCVLAEKDARVLYVYQHNQGPSVARNTGIEKAKGEYIVFLDADDILHPEKISAHLEHFDRLPEADISYGRSRYFLSGKREVTFANLNLNNEDWMPCVSGRAAEIMPALVSNNIMPICAAMLRCDVAKRVRGFDVGRKHVEDWDFWLRVAAVNCYFSYMDDSRLQTYIRVHESSASQNRQLMLIGQYKLRRDCIPGYILLITNKSLSRELLKDNTKRRLRRLTYIARDIGVCNYNFFQLCKGESLIVIVKMLLRLRNKRSE